jgi:hypothetical protein
MPRRSELPTVPPPFNVKRFAEDSEAQLARGLVDSDHESNERASERRLITRPKVTAVSTDEAWAHSLRGMLRAPPLSQLKDVPLDHRSAFLLSWMDGTIDLDTLIEVSTMPRHEVLRIVRGLWRSGLIELC